MFKAVEDGIEVKIPKSLAKFLTGLPDMLDDLGDDADDPGAQRLNPAAYPHDDESQADYDEFSRPQLDQMRDADRQVFRESLESYAKGQVISLDMAEAWLTVIGDARLVLAARAGFNDSGWETQTSATGPVVATLGFVQASLVRELSRAL